MSTAVIRARLRGAAPARLAVPVIALALALVASMPSGAGAVVLESHLPCQKALAKAGRAYTVATLKALRACRLAELGGTAGACSDQRVTDALAKAAAKVDATLAKGCGALTADELAGPRPSGLGLEALATLPASQRSRHDRLVDALLDQLFAAGAGGGVPGEAALDCQAALARGAAAHVASTFKLVGSACHAKEDGGRSVTGESTRLVEACLASGRPALDEAIAKTMGKIRAACPDASFAELGACPDLSAGRTTDAVAACVLARAETAAAAAIGAEHGREQPRVTGRLEARALNGLSTVAAAHATAVLVDADGNDVSSALADADGRVELEARAGERMTLCWQRGADRTCAADPIDVGLESAFFTSRALDVPVAAGEVAITGRLLRADGSPCFAGDAPADLAVQGGVRVGPTGGLPGNDRYPVSKAGDFVVPVPGAGSWSLFADCGAAEVVHDFTTGLDPEVLVPLVVANDPPSAGAIDITDGTGAPVTDPASVSPGDTLDLHATFTDTDALEYRWEITRGDGELRVPGQAVADPRRAAGPDVEWTVDDTTSVHEVTLWVSDGHGNVESLVETIGPLLPGDLASPCLTFPKLQKFLCATGYTASVPEPEGGRSDFLSYMYRNASRNSAGDACLYYNVVDPECIDLNCDGVVDAGTDPLGKCKRMTLGGWWQKNGFDPTTGLGTDVVSAWYLNSNDLGFGREMHCRVTSWSTLIADRPKAAPTSMERFVADLRDDLQASPIAVQYAKLFGLYPSTVACYVTNYTTDHCNKYPTNDPQNADLAYQGQQLIQSNPSVNPTNAYGTVAMEFGPVEGFSDVGAITKFFVYNGRTAAGKRLSSANLDGCGGKSVPEVCMSCHGGGWPGDYSQATDLDNAVAGLSTMAGVLSGIDASDTLPSDAGYQLRRDLIAGLTKEEPGFSSFLPFDPDTYQYPAAASSAAQAASIRELNKLVLYTKPTTPISNLIKGWYGNNLVSGTFAPWRPSAWNDDGGQPGDESDLYDDVYAKACRVCHAAHFDFALPAYFPGSARICDDGSGNAGGSPTMPHAKLTYLNLWKSDFPQPTTMSTLEAWYTASEMGFTSCD